MVVAQAWVSQVLVVAQVVAQVWVAEQQVVALPLEVVAQVLAALQELVLDLLPLGRLPPHHHL